MRRRPTDPSYASVLTAPAPSSAASEENEYDTEPSAGSAAWPCCTVTVGRSSHSSCEPDGTRAKRACQVLVARNAKHFGRKAASGGDLGPPPATSRRQTRH